MPAVMTRKRWLFLTIVAALIAAYVMGHRFVVECKNPTFDLPIGSTSPPPWDSAFNRSVNDRGAQRPDSPLLRYAPQAIVGYVERFSLIEGENLRVRYAGGVLWKPGRLARYSVYDALEGALVREIRLQESPDIPRTPCNGFYQGGCKFSASIEIEGDFAPGTYYIVLEDEAARSSHPIYFNVRAAAVTARVLLLFPEYTWAAYNWFGGGSLYGVLDPETGERLRPDDRSYAVSLDRPLVVSEMSPHGPGATLAAMSVLHEAQMAYQAVADSELDADPTLLDAVDLLVLVGHHEYWPRSMRNTLDRFVGRGGAIANFSGNVGWWHTAVHDRTVYKIARRVGSLCKRIRPTFLRRTDQAILDLPPAQTFGVGFNFGGYPVKRQWEEARREAGDVDLAAWRDGEAVKVVAAEHPVFAGTGLSNGALWGDEAQIIGIELDGVPIDAEGKVRTAYRDMFPGKLQILAHAISFNHHSRPADLNGVHPIGILVEATPDQASGKVLSFGSVGYASALARGGEDGVARRIFLNAVRYLLAPHSPKAKD